MAIGESDEQDAETLQGRVAELEREKQALEQRVVAQENKLKAVVDLLIGADEERDLTAPELVERQPVVDELDEQFDSIDDLQAENERLRARVDDADGKEAKVGQIVRYADNTRSSGEVAVKLTAKEIKGATGCSRRYAYDLMDDLPEEYDWFLTPEEMKQYGSLEIDNSEERRLGIDFEGVHSTGCPLNLFTTQPEGEAAER